ncbi:hypothetical protein FSP39_024286 [Pinctada imbricata]|uniref:Mab-21-like HhH/H2TH-like domain-containing protein n=1 Tax=Pinctada imbricata TaxID=66713 RepID=A0AA88Y0J9_PINIB|nr:hypothetical protein FSP39_024286 [Pinctada imbricata]
MASFTEHNELSLISKGLYRIVSEYMGHECIVTQRRQRWDVFDVILNCRSDIKENKVATGSRAEGFELKSSDFDDMFVDRNVVVLDIPIFPNLQNNINKSTILLMETDEVSPGFAVVKCLDVDTNNTTIFSSLVLRGSDLYVNSKQIRETFQSTNASSGHGPCQTDSFFGFDADRTYALKCLDWPKSAVLFVRRSLERGWPLYDDVTDICGNGCFLVPINSKQQRYSDTWDLEWRISFTFAEKKMVYSMNHCQFLCYGLSKLFLNEVLKKTFACEDLLCSYFIKSAVFWEISEDSNNWSYFNFLSKFWNVFRRLINWVSKGYCPNFFIPENNMFYGKIHGEKQRMLLSTMRDLYREGFRCLLRCTSLNETLSKIFTYPAAALICDENERASMSTIERERLKIILTADTLSISSAQEKRKIVESLRNMLTLDTDSAVMTSALSLTVVNTVRTYAEHLFFKHREIHQHRYSNSKRYCDIKSALSLTRKTRTHLHMNNLLYAKLMYMTGNYHRTIDILHYIVHNLRTQPHKYVWTLNRAFITNMLTQEITYSSFVNSHILNCIKIDCLTAIDELKLECVAVHKTCGESVLFIPPLVFLYFLLFLSYIRIGENQRGYAALEDLRTLSEHCDDRIHIPKIMRAVSWEILGICQEQFGYYNEALQSYSQALNDEHNLFQEATLCRILLLESNDHS